MRRPHLGTLCVITIFCSIISCAATPKNRGESANSYYPRLIHIKHAGFAMGASSRLLLAVWDDGLIIYSLADDVHGIDYYITKLDDGISRDLQRRLQFIAKRFSNLPRSHYVGMDEWSNELIIRRSNGAISAEWDGRLDQMLVNTDSENLMFLRFIHIWWDALYLFRRLDYMAPTSYLIGEDAIPELLEDDRVRTFDVSNPLGTEWIQSIRDK